MSMSETASLSVLVLIINEVGNQPSLFLAVHLYFVSTSKISLSRAHWLFLVFGKLYCLHLTHTPRMIFDRGNDINRCGASEYH